MSRKRPSRPVHRSRDLGDLINALPALFGFPPEDSLVALGLTGPRVTFGMRLDLADLEADVGQAAEMVVGHLERQRVDGAIVLAVGEPLELGRRLVPEVEARLRRVRPVAGGWATGERYWVSMDGGDPAGYPYRRSLDHPASAQAVWEGQEIARSRDAVAAAMTPLGEEQRQEVEERAAHAVAVFGGPSATVDRLDGAAVMADHVVPVLADLCCGRAVSDDALYRLGFLATQIWLRDELWAMVTPDHARAFVRVWLHVARQVPHAWAPPAYSLAAFASWRSGDGARAVMACEQALRLDPTYSLARLMLELATSGISPDQWDGRQDGHGTLNRRG